MVRVPGGSVTIDGKTGDVEPFDIGRTEVTWDMYDVFALGLDASKDQEAGRGRAAVAAVWRARLRMGSRRFPAISIARPAAEAFCDWLSKKTGKTYRLPTEAEWLHAATLARGGHRRCRDRREALAWHRGNAAAQGAAGGEEAAGRARAVRSVRQRRRVGHDRRRRSRRRAADRSAILPRRSGRPTRAVQDDSWQERDPQLPKSKWWLSDGPFVGFRIVRRESPSDSRRRSGDQMP